mgnify:FL=1|tara:strand:- start:1094 stop:1465 length:372 start_codon:yes stop_codon:yes gene_type:complete
MKYFENFPTIEYEGQQVKDITRRNSFTSFVTSNPMLYLPYTVKEGYKPEDVANAYYGSTDFTWLVCMSNNIIDPYHQWPMAESVFNAYLVEKYGEVSGRVGDEVVEWTQEDNGDNIIYYYREV